MSHCIHAGMHIRIIHNIDRGVQEMTDAIRMWTPLYLSGLIESYYNVKPCGGRFSHTIFIARGMAGICGWNPRNQKEGDVYSYITNEEMLRHAEGLFLGLMKNSHQLIKVTVGEGDLLKNQSCENEAETMEPDAEEVAAKKEIRQEMVLDTGEVRIAVSDQSVTISQNGEPHLEFTIRHPLMVMAFQEYIKL